MPPRSPNPKTEPIDSTRPHRLFAGGVAPNRVAFELSVRQAETLGLLSSVIGDKEIAKHLGISFTHRARTIWKNAKNASASATNSLRARNDRRLPQALWRLNPGIVIYDDVKNADVRNANYATRLRRLS